VVVALMSPAAWALDEVTDPPLTTPVSEALSALDWGWGLPGEP
jgi:hypothetical protein